MLALFLSLCLWTLFTQDTGTVGVIVEAAGFHDLTPTKLSYFLFLVPKIYCMGCAQNSDSVLPFPSTHMHGGHASLVAIYGGWATLMGSCCEGFSDRSSLTLAWHEIQAKKNHVEVRARNELGKTLSPINSLFPHPHRKPGIYRK